jgi:hypothetical protein
MSKCWDRERSKTAHHKWEFFLRRTGLLLTTEASRRCNPTTTHSKDGDSPHELCNHNRSDEDHYLGNYRRGRALRPLKMAPWLTPLLFYSTFEKFWAYVDNLSNQVSSVLVCLWGCHTVVSAFSRLFALCLAPVPLVVPGCNLSYREINPKNWYTNRVASNNRNLRETPSTCTTETRSTTRIQRRSGKTYLYSYLIAGFYPLRSHQRGRKSKFEWVSEYPSNRNFPK